VLYSYRNEMKKTTAPPTTGKGRVKRGPAGERGGKRKATRWGEGTIKGRERKGQWFIPDKKTTKRETGGWWVRGG